MDQSPRWHCEKLGGVVLSAIQELAQFFLVIVITVSVFTTP